MNVGNVMVYTSVRKNRQFVPDIYIILISAVLLVIGLLMVASASMVVSDQQYGYPFHYFIRQNSYIILGIIIAFIMTKIPMIVWRKYGMHLLLLCLLSLVLVLVPGIGRVVNGSRRWVSLGFVTLQVSEFAKLGAIVFLARYIDRRENELRVAFKGFIKPLIILGLFAGLFLLEPDFGSTVVLTATFLSLLFIAEVPISSFVIVFAIILSMFGGLILVAPYRLARLTTFVNPWLTQFGSGYQLTQSLIAFGRGGIFGVGLGNSMQKLFYLPEAHTDFLFAVLTEELGLIGAVVLLSVFVLLVGRMLYLAREALKQNRLFIAYVAFGLAFWLAYQALINVGVNTGLLPTKGLTLPFISYGGSSMLVNFMILGIMLRISSELKYPAGE
jgi:cell division protein FtsW